MAECADGMAEWRNGGWNDDGMAEWRNGRMAEWRTGRMAEWRNGGMAEWWNGGWNGGITEWQPNGGMVEWLNGTEWQNDSMIEKVSYGSHNITN